MFEPRVPLHLNFSEHTSYALRRGAFFIAHHPPQTPCPTYAPRWEGNGEKFGNHTPKVRGGEAVMARFRDFGLVTFWDGSTRLRPQAIADLRNSLVGHLDAINRASIPMKIPEADWSKYSPQDFERICRELLCRSGKFDPDTVRSFGKVNSRDGGRDIEIRTRARPGVSPAKWIFQCKRYLNGRSITKSDINVSDMIDEYGIEGFGIMTSGDGYSEILEAVRTQIRAQISKVFPTAQIAANSIWACIRGSRLKEKQKSGLVPLPSMLT